MNTRYSALRGALRTAEDSQSGPGSLFNSLEMNTAESQHVKASLTTKNAHIAAFLTDDDPVSSPPSSSPPIITPQDCVEELDVSHTQKMASQSRCGTVDLIKRNEEPGVVTLSIRRRDPPCNFSDEHQDRPHWAPPESPFLKRLDELLLAAQSERLPAARHLPLRSTSGNTHLAVRSGTSRRLDNDGPRSGAVKRKLEAMGTGTALKKRKISTASRSRSKLAKPSGVPSLFGAFKLPCANRPGSLRRAESLRSKLSAEEVEENLNEVGVTFQITTYS